MAKIKFKHRVYTYTPVNSDDHLRYIDLLVNGRVVPFIEKLRFLLNSTTDERSKYRAYVTIENLFGFNYVSLSAEEGVADFTRILVDSNKELIPKIFNLYTNICTIVPMDPYINNLKYLFYNHLISDYGVKLNHLEFLDSSNPYMFLLPLLATTWWDAQFIAPVAIPRIE